MKKFDDMYNELQQVKAELESATSPEEKKELEERIKDLEYALAVASYKWLFEE